jgi:hydrogenase 3 maturation protease
MKRLLLGVGNRLSRDDGVGPAAAERMDGAEGWIAVDCGSALENASGIVRRENPDLLVVVDAARMGLPAGSIRRLPLDATDRMLASTHGLPLGFVIERLRPAAGDVLLVGVEPADLSFGEGLSDPVSTAVEDLVGLLRAGELDRVAALDAADVS